MQKESRRTLEVVLSQAKVVAHHEERSQSHASPRHKSSSYLLFVLQKMGCYKSDMRRNFLPLKNGCPLLCLKNQHRPPFLAFRPISSASTPFHFSSTGS